MRDTLLLLFIFCLSSLFVKAQPMNVKFDAGHYYDLTGKKWSGYVGYYIHQQPNPEKGFFYFIYSRAKKNSDQYAIFVSLIRSLVVGKDSFVVCHDPEMYQTPLLRVVVNSKDTVLYEVKIISQGYMPGMMGGAGMVAGAGTNYSGTRTAYYYGVSPDIVTELTRHDFVKVMSGIMKDKPNVVARIKDKTYRYGDIDELVTFYIDGKLPEKPILFKGKQ